jgi:hypothetical protein
MVNRQDVPYSPGSPEVGRAALAAGIIFDGTKLALERSRHKTTTEGRNCSFPPNWPSTIAPTLAALGFLRRDAKQIRVAEKNHARCALQVARLKLFLNGV